MTQIILVERLKVSDALGWMQIFRVSCHLCGCLTPQPYNPLIWNVKITRTGFTRFSPDSNNIYGEWFTFTFFFMKYERAEWLVLRLWSVDPAVMYEWEYGTIWIIISGIRAASKQIISWLNNFTVLYHTSLRWSSTPIILNGNCVSIISPARAGGVLSTGRYDFIPESWHLNACGS